MSVSVSRNLKPLFWQSVASPGCQGSHSHLDYPQAPVGFHPMSSDWTIKRWVSFRSRWQPGFLLLVFQRRFPLFSWELPLTVSFTQSHQQMRQFVMHKKPHSDGHLSPCVCYHAPAVCFHTHFPYTILKTCKICWTDLMTSVPDSKNLIPDLYGTPAT